MLVHSYFFNSLKFSLCFTVASNTVVILSILQFIILFLLKGEEVKEYDADNRTVDSENSQSHAQDTNNIEAEESSSFTNVTISDPTLSNLDI